MVSEVRRRLVQIAARLAGEVGALDFAPPVAHVYNPLDYAFAAHRAYLERWARPEVEAVLLGMNPGPFGMAQTGVPFGDVVFVREWMGIETEVGRPPTEHPKRPVLGFASTRREVSGSRLWGWARDRFESPEAFFRRFFVLNYCPLAFLEGGGRNRIPEKLPAAERSPLFEACDRALAETVACLRPRRVIGVGGFAEGRARAALGPEWDVGRILHPSPASPKANRGWAEAAEAELQALGIGWEE